MTVNVLDAAEVPKSFRTRQYGGEHMAVQAVEAPQSIVTLATALTAGSAAAVVFGYGAGVNAPAFYQLTMWGTPDDSTLKIEFSPDGGITWIDTDITQVSANQIVGFTAVEGAYRATVVDAGGATSWNADLRGAL